MHLPHIHPMTSDIDILYDWGIIGYEDCIEDLLNSGERNPEEFNNMTSMSARKAGSDRRYQVTLIGSTKSRPLHYPGFVVVHYHTIYLHVAYPYFLSVTHISCRSPMFPVKCQLLALVRPNWGSPKCWVMAVFYGCAELTFFFVSCSFFPPSCQSPLLRFQNTAELFRSVSDRRVSQQFIISSMQELVLCVL